jgi:t-SNARE complex subunit (syntaxin)
VSYKSVGEDCHWHRLGEAADSEMERGHGRIKQIVVFVCLLLVCCCLLFMFFIVMFFLLFRRKMKAM